MPANTLPELEQHIQTGWEQIRVASDNHDWIAMQVAFRNMAKLQDLHEQSRLLENQIAALSNQAQETPIANMTSEWPQPPAPTRTSAAYGVRRATTRPREIRIGAFRKVISLNNQVPIETANWLIGQGHGLPLVPNFIQRTRESFTDSAQVKPLLDGYFIEVGDSQEALFQKARKLMNICGRSGVRIEILMEDGAVKTI